MTADILVGDSLEQLKTLPDATVNTCVTSPPYYGLRDYGVDGQIGLEETPEHYINKLVELFREVKRVLRDDGTLWVNIGDSYASTSGEKSISPQTAYLTGRAGGNAYAPGNKLDNLETQKTGCKNYGDCKPKDLIGIPWMLAFALRADGWYLRQDIIWAKPNPMPESVKDRCTNSHEYIFLLSKSKQYYYDAEAIAEKSTEYERCLTNPPRFGGNKYGDDETEQTRTKSGKEWNPTMGGGGTSFIGHKGNFKADGTPISGATRNKRSVWTVTTKPFKGSHFAVFPPDLIEPCILAGCPADGLVLDPFTGSGTTGVVALKNGRNFVGCELNPQYAEMAKERIKREGIYQERIGLEA